MSSIESLLLHPRTRADVTTYIKQPAQALMIVGETGSGKIALALAIAANLLKVTPDKLEQYPYFIRLQKPKDKKEIPIENVRELLKKMILKTQGSEIVRRVVVIEQADKLSEEAQNALLKALEEPAPDTVFILTAPSRRNILPTVVSRTQVIPVHNVLEADTLKFYTDKYALDAIQNAWRLSSGAAKLTESILTDSEHPFKKSIDEAKLFLTTDIYDRLLMTEEMSKDKQRLNNLFDALGKVLEALQRSPSNQSKAATSALLKNRRVVAKLQKELNANANTRLIALGLALNLKL